MSADEPVESEPARTADSGSHHPLSPTLVASLRLDLAWLDARRSPAAVTSTASEPDHSASSTMPRHRPARRQSIPPNEGTASPTLASRRIHAAKAGGHAARPPLFRRRSRSLDDISASPSMEDSLTEFGPAPPTALRVNCVAAPTTSTLATTGPPPPLSAVSVDGSLTSLTSHSTTTTVTPSSKSPRPRPARFHDGSGIGGMRMSECDDRLAKWVASSSTSTNRASSTPLTPRRVAKSSTSVRAASPGHLPMPPAPLQTTNYAPALPSPLSTCSYTSEADDEARGGRECDSPEDAPRGGFPFPLTPSRVSPSATHDAGQTLCGSDGVSTRRPTLQARESVETNSSLETEVVDTPQPAVSPDGGHIVASPLPGAFTSNRTGTSYYATSTASDVPGSTSSSPIPSGSSTFSFGDANAYAYGGGRRPSVASTSSASASAATRSAGVPLTPPEGHSTSPFLFGASAAEMAWHEVLGARYGAGTSVGSGSAGSGGGGPVSTQPLDLLRRKEDTAATAAGLVIGATVAGQSPGSSANGRDEAGRLSGNAANPQARGAGAEAGTGAAAAASAGERPWCGNELMGSVAGGGYAATTRETLARMLEQHIADVPFEAGAGTTTVQLVEYGALNSRSSALVRPVLEHFAKRELVALRAELTRSEDEASAEAVEGAGVLPPPPPPAPTRRFSDSSNPDLDELVSFQVTHVDRPTADFRCLADSLENDPSSYLRPRGRRSGDPKAERDSSDLDGRVFSNFAARPFGIKAVPRKSVSVGWSAMSLHWPATDRRYRVAPATLAHGELMSFLSARASEFKPGGVLVLAYIARTEEAALAATMTSGSPSMPASTPSPTAASSSSPSSKGSPIVRANPDIWADMTRLLGKAIQRLVSTGLLKPQVARLLLALPLHPRTPRQTAACLRASAHSWDVLDSEMVTLSHPAWKGVEHGTVGIESWADHTIQMLKVFWEEEMRTILRDVLGSRGACEWVLDCLWTVAKEKIEDQPPQPLDLEVQFIALRRRTSSSSSSRDVTPSAVTAVNHVIS
ncbi:hypothetical protein JCM3774_004140 [Rhodotorula dairenensis]